MAVRGSSNRRRVPIYGCGAGLVMEYVVLRINRCLSFACMPRAARGYLNASLLASATIAPCLESVRNSLNSPRIRRVRRLTDGAADRIRSGAGLRVH